MTDDKEFRLNSIEFRMEEAEDGTEKLILEGYAAVWDQETLIGSKEYGFYESIAREAVEGADMKDTPLRYNHDNSNLILARVRNKSLKLTTDDKGLFMHAELQPDIQAHRDAYNMVKSGLVDKMSFAFNVTKQEVTRGEGTPHRRILGIGKLFDVSIVDTPAYDGTSVYARSIDSVETELRRLESLQEPQVETREAEEKRQLEIERLKNINRMKLI